MPGVQIPSRWVNSDLDGEAVIATSPRGYINDVLALEWFEHFVRHTKPAREWQKRIILLDGCDSHFTKDLFVLTREIADGTTDFLFYLQKIRRRTTKQSTIPSSWRKFGLFPYNPSEVLDRMVNPLSSLTAEVAESQLPGYTSLGSSSDDGSDSDDENDEEDGDDAFQKYTTGRSSRRGDHNHVLNAPESQLDGPGDPPPPFFRIRRIQQCERYVKLRIDASIMSGVALTLSVAHINEKVRKASTTLAINGITVTQEMLRLKEKNLSRRAHDEWTSIVANYGPTRASDARLRVAKDYHNR
ncbi:hypothetical protein FALCPG4_015076 [Fusarium falciforme]